MIIKYEIFNQDQFLKSGKLRKKPKTERAFLFADVEPSKESDKELFTKETAEQIKKSYKNFDSPYIFTHLKAQNEKGENVFIFESVMINNDYIMTSPVKMRELLQ